MYFASNVAAQIRATTTTTTTSQNLGKMACFASNLLIVIFVLVALSACSSSSSSVSGSSQQRLILKDKISENRTRQLIHLATIRHSLILKQLRNSILPMREWNGKLSDLLNKEIEKRKDSHDPYIIQVAKLMLHLQQQLRKKTRTRKRRSVFASSIDKMVHFMTRDNSTLASTRSRPTSEPVHLKMMTSTRKATTTNVANSLLLASGRPCTTFSNDCQFKGECLELDGLNVPLCKCQPGYKGTFCENYDLLTTITTLNEASRNNLIGQEQNLPSNRPSAFDSVIEATANYLTPLEEVHYED